MEDNHETAKDLLQEDYTADEKAGQGKENLAMTLRTMNDNMKMFRESLKRLHEPEPGSSGQGSKKGGATKSAHKKRTETVEGRYPRS